MRYKIFNAETGEPLGSVDDIGRAVDLARIISSRGLIVTAIKDENTGAIL